MQRAGSKGGGKGCSVSVEMAGKAAAEEGQRLSFDALASIVSQSRRGGGRGEEALGQLKRTPREQARYNAFLASLRESHESVDDYILHLVFGVPLEDGGEGKKRACAEAVRDLFGSDEPTIRWRENDFPYALEDGIAHQILWSSKPLTDEETAAQVSAYLARRGVTPAGREGTSAECINFVNPPRFRSIQNLWHAHVLINEA